MKVGLSVSRCIRDIVHELVHIDDVLVIVGRTAAADQDRFKRMMEQYHTAGAFDGPEGIPDYRKCEEIGMTLYDTGRIHQPRLFDPAVRWMPIPLVHWVSLMPVLDEMNPLTKSAYTEFLAAAKLSGVETHARNMLGFA